MRSISRFVRGNSARFAAALAAAGASVSAMAETTVPTVDVSSITGTSAPIAQVGAAVFAVMVGIKLWKWVRRAL